MRVQDFIANQTEMITEGLLPTVKALPADKLNWKPLDNGRSARPISGVCRFPSDHDTGPERRRLSYEEEDTRLRKSPITVDEADKCLRDGNSKLLSFIREMPDSKLAEKIDLPWGATWTLGEVANMHYWNLVYHVGQINYIQTLLGDFEMH